MAELIAFTLIFVTLAVARWAVAKVVKSDKISGSGPRAQYEHELQPYSNIFK